MSDSEQLVIYQLHIFILGISPMIWGKSGEDTDLEIDFFLCWWAIAHDDCWRIHVEGLKPSRDLLVIVLEDQEQSLHLQRRAALTLQQQGINFYIPSAPTINQFLDQKAIHEKRPNDFWKDDAVTISRIHRAKGNEAYMVYLIGFQHIAHHESSISLRNQLFVAFTRSKAWVQVSGVGDYPMYEELRKVMDNPHEFTFTYRKPLGRVIGEENLSS